MCMEPLVIVILALCSSSFAEYTVDEGVIVLKRDNFADAVKDNKYILVEFYASWCGACKALAPEYSKAAQILAAENPDIKLAKVDAIEETELAEQFQINGFPTMKLFKEGKLFEHEASGGVASDIVKWLKIKTGPPAKELSTPEEAILFSSSDDVVVIGFFKEQTSDAAKAFLETAERLNVYFGISYSQEVANALEAELDTMVLFKKFDNKRATYSADWNTKDIESFVADEQMPLLNELNGETVYKIFDANVRAFLFAFYLKDSEKAVTYASNLRTVAADFKGKILFVHIDPTVEETAPYINYFNMETKSLPSLLLLNPEKGMERFVPEFQEPDVDKLQGFIKSFVDGTLQPHRNTEEIPADWNSKSVKVLVGKNFADVVYDENENVFVEFYSPSCGHCKQLAPTWDQLGEHFKDNEEIIIAKMDSTKNNVEGIHIQGFPTLKLFPKGANKKAVDYNGDRTLDDLITFVEEHLVPPEVTEEKMQQGSNEEHSKLEL